MEAVSDEEMCRRMEKVKAWEALRDVFSDLSDEELDKIRDYGKTGDLFKRDETP